MVLSCYWKSGQPESGVCFLYGHKQKPFNPEHSMIGLSMFDNGNALVPS